MFIVARLVFDKWLAVAFRRLGVARCGFLEPGVDRCFFFTLLPDSECSQLERLCSEVVVWIMSQ